MGFELQSWVFLVLCISLSARISVFPLTSLAGYILLGMCYLVVGSAEEIFSLVLVGYIMGIMSEDGTGDKGDGKSKREEG